MLNMSLPYVMETSLVTILAIFLFIYIMMRVGGMRGKHKIEAPAVTGNPEFERAYRVQMNTLEQSAMFLPALWLATAYVAAITWLPLPWLPALLGLVWIIGRFMYLNGYIADPAKRSTGFLISGIATILLVIIAIIGIVMTWMAVSSSGGTAAV
jgi:glutathione S-transferase